MKIAILSALALFSATNGLKLARHHHHHSKHRAPEDRSTNGKYPFHTPSETAPWCINTVTADGLSTCVEKDRSYTYPNDLPYISPDMSPAEPVFA